MILNQNLSEIAAHWVHLATSPAPVDWEAQDLPDDVKETLKAAETEEIGECWIEPENTHIADLFFAIDSAWRYAPMGGIIGLDMPQAIAYWDALGLQRTPDEVRAVLFIASHVVRDLNATKSDS